MLEAECLAISESNRRDRPFDTDGWVRQIDDGLRLESSLRGPGRPRR